LERNLTALLAVGRIGQNPEARNYGQA